MIQLNYQTTIVIMKHIFYRLINISQQSKFNNLHVWPIILTLWPFSKIYFNLASKSRTKTSQNVPATSRDFKYLYSERYSTATFFTDWRSFYNRPSLKSYFVVIEILVRFLYISRSKLTTIIRGNVALFTWQH